MKTITLWILFTSPHGIILETTTAPDRYYGEVGMEKCLKDGEKLQAQYKIEHPDKSQPSVMCFAQEPVGIKASTDVSL